MENRKLDRLLPYQTLYHRPLQQHLLYGQYYL